MGFERVSEETHGELSKLNWLTLSDARAESVRPDSRFFRVALIITGACNFKCPYCNVLGGKRAPTMKMEETFELLDFLAKKGLKELRISGGEPTLVPWLPSLASKAGGLGVRVAVSSNGFADESVYAALIDAGVSEFSISMDSADPQKADDLSGNQRGVIAKVRSTISFLSANGTAVYIGMTCGKGKSAEEMRTTVALAESLGSFEIKIMSLSQEGAAVDVSWVGEEMKRRFPLLAWRAANYERGLDVRGLSDSDSPKCAVALDDATIAGGRHYPCNVYFRESGAPIGFVGPGMLRERATWFASHNGLQDAICRKNCMDILREYNNKAMELNAFVRASVESLPGDVEKMGDGL